MAKYVKLKKVWKMLHGLGGCDAEPGSWADGWDKAIDAAIGELDKLPAADVQEVRHGKWLTDDSDNPYRCVQIYCSECNYFNLANIKSAYCHHCGAKMDGKEGKNG